MEERTQNVQCTALTRAGLRCKNRAQSGSSFCHVHVKEGTGALSSESDAIEVVDEQELRRQLIKELDDLMIQVRQVLPEYSPPEATGGEMQGPGDGGVGGGTGAATPSILSKLLGRFSEDLLDPETWKGIWYMASYTMEYQSDLLKRRITGDYETDEWGLDWEFIEASRPLLDFLYKYYWRVESQGLEHVSDYDRTLLVCNQTHQPGWDPTLLMATILNEHPAQRLVRNLYSAEIPTLPVISSLMIKMGQAVNSRDNGLRLLEQEELVAVYPEQIPLFSRSPREFYSVSRFRDTRFVQMAVDTESPIIPVTIISSADSLIARSRREAQLRASRTPALKGLLTVSNRRYDSLLPIPGKMTVVFGEPILLSGDNRGDMSELEFRSRMADGIRDRIQESLNQYAEREPSAST